jgi:hypothetical protein
VLSAQLRISPEGENGVKSLFLTYNLINCVKNKDLTPRIYIKKEGFFKTFVVLVLKCRKIEKD